MSTLRELKGRILSVGSTEKITGAMKMISSSKMHKAEQALRRLVPYRGLVQDVIGHLLATDCAFTSPLIERREVKRAAMVVFGSDDGLCGAYNINVYKQVAEKVKALLDSDPKVEVELLPVGKKMRKQVVKLSGKRVKVVPETGIDTRSKQPEIAEFTRQLQDRFLSGEIDSVELIYMHFVTISRQRYTCETLLPVSYDALVKKGEGSKKVNTAAPCLFEPDPNAIFNSVLPLHIQSVMQEICTENVASENAARVMAMQSATDNAKKLLEALRLEYNKLRQASITTELLDIVGGQVKR